MSRPKPKKLFQELRHREVFKTAALYIVAAWVVLQVSDLAFPGLGVPDHAIRYVWLGLIVLFPLVLVFGWYYDVSSSGVRRTLSTTAAESDRALHSKDYWAIGGFASVTVAVTVAMAYLIRPVESQSKSI